MIIFVDDEEIALHGAKDALMSVFPDAEAEIFSRARKALEYVEENEVSCAFLDISMPVINGVDLAKRIKIIRPNCNIIFTTGYDSYYADAFDLGASDYLLKPITPEKIKHALEHLRFPIEGAGDAEGADEDNGVVIKCFGNFEIFCHGAPVKFKRSKSKEMLAYLVSRDGASITKNEIMANIFEKDDTSYYGVLKKDLTDTLDALGIGEILLRTWKNLAIDKSRVKCDFYDFLSGTPEGLNAYRGEFMVQYSWAEFLSATLFND